MNLEISLPDAIRPATRKDWRQLGDITAEAFAEDPFNLWLFGGERALRPLFRIMARDIYLKHGFCHIAGDGAATMWATHESNLRFPPLALVQLMAAQMIHGTKGSMKRGMAAGEAMEKYHPSEPHLYLFTIGTRKAARGKGLGKAMMNPVLAVADKAGLPVYLENSNPANHGFYTSFGFEKLGDFRVLDDSPPMAPMWREAKSL
ncbi:MAG: GNAT family N-acetyltransferase [Henriciella sp.]|uniref:GNAT family N-acetyltransferase n=1 Tax=Henriciella sp. TaxID=1968823 RepID=UPI003C754525